VREVVVMRVMEYPARVVPAAADTAADMVARIARMAVATVTARTEVTVDRAMEVQVVVVVVPDAAAADVTFLIVMQAHVLLHRVAMVLPVLQGSAILQVTGLPTIPGRAYWYTILRKRVQAVEMEMAAAAAAAAAAVTMVPAAHVAAVAVEQR
jgi:hypothetical protein